MRMSKAKEKVRPIVFKGEGDFEGREFTLDYTRKTVAKAERAGLNVNAMDSQPMTMIYLMFWGAFLSHHPRMTQEQTDKILDEQFGGIEGLSSIKNADGETLIEHLGKLYAAPFSTLAPDEEEENPPKVAVQF